MVYIIVGWLLMGFYASYRGYRLWKYKQKTYAKGDNILLFLMGFAGPIHLIVELYFEFRNSKTE